MAEGPDDAGGHGFLLVAVVAGPVGRGPGSPGQVGAFVGQGRRNAAADRVADAGAVVGTGGVCALRVRAARIRSTGVVPGAFRDLGDANATQHEDLNRSDGMPDPKAERRRPVELAMFMIELVIPADADGAGLDDLLRGNLADHAAHLDGDTEVVVVEGAAGAQIHNRARRRHVVDTRCAGVGGADAGTDVVLGIGGGSEEAHGNNGRGGSDDSHARSPNGTRG